MTQFDNQIVPVPQRVTNSDELQAAYNAGHRQFLLAPGAYRHAIISSEGRIRRIGPIPEWDRDYPLTLFDAEESAPYGDVLTVVRRLNALLESPEPQLEFWRQAVARDAFLVMSTLPVEPRRDYAG